MENQNDLLWKSTLAAIETEVSRANFLTLFKPTKLLSLEENIATIAAPSPMVNALLQKRFYSQIKQALDAQTKNDNELFFIVKTLEKPIKKPDQGLFAKQEEQKQVAPVGHLPRVRPDYTFETLAVSTSNQLAYEASKTVANRPGTTYNPLFIYGPVGVGKTHLMHAIANSVYQQNPDKKIIYITSEEFTNEVVDAIRTNETAKMKRRFRNVSLLIIDDIQFIAGKDRVQEELFHTFNILIDNSAQIVLSSDRPPGEIKKLEKRLSSRFSGGLSVDVEAPDFELKTAILLKKAEKHGFDLPIDVAKALAEKAEDARSLEGLLLRVMTQSKSQDSKATVAMVHDTFASNDSPKHLHSEDVVKQVCFFYNIKTTQLKGPKRDASLVKARQIAMYLLKKELGLTFVEIGNIMGGRDHTTVMYGVEKVENLLKTQPRLSSDILGITKSFSG